MKILFQGDSVTDCDRSRTDETDLGKGYVPYTAALLRERFPETAFTFVNRGVSGNRSADLVARFEADFAAVRPDVVSVMIGVNDTWRRYDSNDPTDEKTFYKNYRTVLEGIRARLGAKIVMLEAFLADVPDKPFREDFNRKLDMTRMLAREYADAYVPLDGLFAAACVEHEPTFWTADGIHPAEPGKQLIAQYAAAAIGTVIGRLQNA